MCPSIQLSIIEEMVVVVWRGRRGDQFWRRVVSVGKLGVYGQLGESAVFMGVTLWPIEVFVQVWSKTIVKFDANIFIDYVIF